MDTDNTEYFGVVPLHTNHPVIPFPAYLRRVHASNIVEENYRAGECCM